MFRTKSSKVTTLPLATIMSHAGCHMCCATWVRMSMMMCAAVAACVRQLHMVGGSVLSIGTYCQLSALVVLIKFRTRNTCTGQLCANAIERMVTSAVATSSSRSHRVVMLMACGAPPWPPFKLLKPPPGVAGFPPKLPPKPPELL